MAWYPAVVRRQMQTFLNLAGEEFYGGAQPAADAGNLVPDIQIDYDDNTVNANLFPLGAGLGVMVSELFTQLVDDQNAQVFVLGHEYGHGMTATVMQLANLRNLTGPCEEVIADLISAYLLSLMQIAPNALMNSLRGAQQHVFNTHANMVQAGHHPAGDDRIAYINTLATLLPHFSFADSVKGILMSLGCT